MRYEDTWYKRSSPECHCFLEMTAFATNVVSGENKTKPQYICGTEESIKDSVKKSIEQCDWQL